MRLEKELLRTVFMLTLIFWSGLGLFAQESDTLDVPPMYENYLEEIVPALAHYIVSDTTDTGERLNPNRVYRLQRYRDELNPGVYLLDYGMDIDFSLNIVAEKGDGRPPIIVPEYTSEGAILGYLFKFISDNKSYRFENIFFQRVNLDRQFTGNFLRGIFFEGDNTRAVFQGCIFNAFTGGATIYLGKDNTMIYRDCVWRNGEWPSHPWLGQQNNFGETIHQDTLIFTNNIYFNNNAFWLYHVSEIIDFVVIEHNTLMTSITDAIRMKSLVNANIRSNLYYGYAAYGDTRFARESGSWFEPDGDSLCHISLDPLSAPVLGSWGKQESDRIINVTHNAWYTPQALQDYYTDFADYDPPHTALDPVSAPIWMNSRTKNMFNDTANWPHMTEGSNDYIDPQMKDTEMDAWLTENVALWCGASRETSTTDGWGSAGQRNYDQYLGDDICLGIQWPLPEGNMEITNPSLLSAGHDGLPVGSLTWDPEMRAQYAEPEAIELNPNVGIANRFLPEFRIFPNPAKEKLSLSFAVEPQSIQIYNLMGQELAALSMKGTITKEMDISSLSEGVYILRVKYNERFYSKIFIKESR